MTGHSTDDTERISLEQLAGATLTYELKDGTVKRVEFEDASSVDTDTDSPEEADRCD